MSRTLILAATVLLLVLPGCSGSGSQMDLPTYPTGMRLSPQESSDEDKGEYTAHCRGYACSDSYEQVEKWYEDELVVKLGWKKMGAGEWADPLKNAQPDSSYYYVTAKDPSKPGGRVVIYRDKEGTLVRMLQVKPK
ncbi:MAG: hypothetical protein HY319_11985 [Armatimonadetes bacterium]|nr:hypothetical protein [Armatimonadota bacterium]